MPKHDSDTKKSKKKTSKSGKHDAAAAPKLSPKAAKRIAEQAAKDQAKAAKAAKAEAKAAKAAPPAAVDEAHVLRLALRDTEAKLTETEAALRRVQQELENERRAAVDAAIAPLEERIVDEAVAETIAEAVAHADTDVLGEGAEAIAVERIADELDAVAAAADVSDEPAPHGDSARDAAAAFSDAAVVTPPEPVATAEHADDEPSESWTLFRLRAEARSRHLAGFSTLSKADLLARLRA